MDRILSSLGCFGLTLLAILFALGVTEAIKYVGPLEKALVLAAAVLAAAVVAYLRHRIKNGPLPTLHKSEPTHESTQEERLDRVATRSRKQSSQVDLDAVSPAQMSSLMPPEAGPPIHEAILASRTQAILFRQIVPPNYDPTHLSFFGGLPIAPSGFGWPRGQSRPYTFIMQLDCSAVPADGRLGMFPNAGPEPAARIPLDVVDYIRSRHALACVLESGLHMNIPDRMLAPPVDVQGTIDDRVREFILLFEMSSNEGLAHYFGEGVCQFWIRPDDLAARRFDRVELSTTAY